jgi:protocatechuate 3,4-dioxygenase beta subunit
MLHPVLATRRALMMAGLLLPVGSCTEYKAVAGTTPMLREGEYYPREIPGDADADLLHVAGASQPAQGTPLLLTGQVRRIGGLAEPGTAMEIWQPDAAGIYMHPRDPNLGRRDLGFQGYGRATTNGVGRYAFTTLVPGLFPGRARHIHLRIFPPGTHRALTTVIFFPEDANKGEDPVWTGLSPIEREMLTARLTRSADGMRATFDVILA